MIDQQSTLSLRNDATFQSMGKGKETVILSLSSGYLFTCNDTTRTFLENLDGRRTLGEVIDLLLERFDVPREKLTADMTALAGKLLDEKILQVAP